MANPRQLGDSVYQIDTDPATNTITFSTAQTERLTIDANGNVGIGTNLPTAKVQVSSNRATTSIAQSWDVYNGVSFENSIVLGYTGSAGYVGNAQNNPFVFLTNNTERVRIDTSGNVGIGTNSPTTKLDVVGNAKISGNIIQGGIDTRAFAIAIASALSI